ncbi:GNAT family N-acetyltransferase [Nonomuraea wenchangensis]
MSAVRAATDADMPAVRRIARRFGLLAGWPQGDDFLNAERAFGTLLIAPGSGEDAAGFGGTLRRADLTHLGDLFVLPDRQSGGVGRALLAELLAGDGPKVTFASSDPRALALYLRHGLRPWTPLLYLTGPAAPLPAPLPAPAVRAARPEEVADADARVSGGARPGTLSWYAARPDVTSHATGAGGYAFARRSGDDTLIGPAGGATPGDCADAVLGALAATGARTGRIAVPGPHPLVPLLLGAGWHIADHDTLMADEAALARLRPDRYVPHPDLG